MGFAKNTLREDLFAGPPAGAAGIGELLYMSLRSLVWFSTAPV